MDLERLAIALARGLNWFSVELPFQIRRIFAIGAAYDLIFTGGGVHHEFFGLGTAHGAGVGIDDQVVEATTIEDSAISLAVLLVRDIEAGGVNVEESPSLSS